MTTSSPRTYRTCLSSGEILEDLAARGMIQCELAARLGRPERVVNEIIKAKKAITLETAIGLEKVLGIDAHFWVNLEANYRLTLVQRQRLPNKGQA